MDECQRILQDRNRSPEQDAFLSALPEGQTEEELEAEIQSEKARLELLHQDNPNLIRDYEHRQKQINNLQERVAKAEESLADLSNGIGEIRQKWEPELDVLIKSISDAFSYSFEKIGCAGEVGVHKDEDFDQWSIEIQVKFR
jgi:structural maintenance of chromosomes protein 5